MSNLVKRARAAAGLTQLALAKLLGVGQPLISRWERGSKLSAPAVALLTVLEREPEAALRALHAAHAADAPGFTGDGGPPPVRSQGQGQGPPTDEFGWPTAEGPAPEPDVGWAPGDDLGVSEFSLEFDAGADPADPADPAETADDLDENGDFFTPGFDGGEDQE